MTAAQLNRLYGWYIAAPGHLTLSDLLEGVRKYAITKFYRDLDKEDIAQECVTRVWRHIDPTALNPLKYFDPKGTASFSTWLSKICFDARSNHIRDLGQVEETTDAETLGRLASPDAWHSEGRSHTGATPPESFYYEQPDPKCRIPLGKSNQE